MSDETKLLVRTWLESDIELSLITEMTQIPPNVEWALKVQVVPDRTVTVVQGKDSPDQIVIQCCLSLAQPHADGFAALEAKDRAGFLLTLRRDAMLLGVAYRGLSDP